LIRIVKTPDGNVVVDATGKQSGRGAYICRNKECLEKSFKTKKLNKSLNTAISDEIFNKLRDEVLDAE
ncbi:MAG: YlxR family protein, partial [Inconstantimicrobium porci]|uniref:RNase P modulator RnpM n=1 Tax=Inconstantimicrobium porci TaxID=2652291 RepID=UPI002A91175D